MTRRNTPVTRWLRANRGQMSQAAFVADLEAVTGWALLRENYSKYETGAMKPEPETLARFIAYHEHYGRTGPDLTPEPEPEPEPSMAATLITLARAWEKEREESEARFRAVEAELRSLRGQLADAVSQGRLVPQGNGG